MCFYKYISGTRNESVLINTKSVNVSAVVVALIFNSDITLYLKINRTVPFPLAT